MALKARRDYKDIVKQTEEVKVLITQAQKTKATKELPKDDSELQAQRVEFGAYLNNKVAHQPSRFFLDMKAKLDEGTELTPNMVKAIRNAMERDTAQASKTESSEECETITLKLRPFLMQAMELDSRIITGKVLKETQKAWLIEGHADMLEHMSWCVRCGRKLTEPASQITGMGAICAEKSGMEYDPKEVLGASKKKRDAIRKSFQKKLRAQKFERWIPKSGAERLGEDDL